VFFSSTFIDVNLSHSATLSTKNSSINGGIVIAVNVGGKLECPIFLSDAGRVMQEILEFLKQELPITSKVSGKDIP
jgi:hypothetical protein